MHVLDADGFKLLPLFSIRHEAFTSLIFQMLRGGLMFWVNELSVYPSPLGSSASFVFTSSSRLRCWYTDCEARAAQASPTLLLCTARRLWGCNY